MSIVYNPRARDWDHIKSVDGTFADKFTATFAYNPSAGYDNYEFVSSDELVLSFSGGDISVPTDQAALDQLHAEVLSLLNISTPDGSSSVADAFSIAEITNDSIRLSINWTNLINAGYSNLDVADINYNPEGIANPLLQDTDGVPIPTFLSVVDIIFEPQLNSVQDSVQESGSRSINIFFDGPGLNIPNADSTEAALDTLANELSIFRDFDAYVEIADSIVGVTEIGENFITVDLDLTAIYNSGVNDGDEL